MSLGGYTDTQDATLEVQQIAEMVRRQLEVQMKQRFQVYDAIQYRSQVVEGTNYIIKVHFEYEKHGYVHVKVFQPLTQGCLIPPPQLVGEQDNKTLCSDIDIF